MLRYSSISEKCRRESSCALLSSCCCSLALLPVLISSWFSVGVYTCLFPVSAAVPSRAIDDTSDVLPLLHQVRQIVWVAPPPPLRLALLLRTLRCGDPSRVSGFLRLSYPWEISVKMGEHEPDRGCCSFEGSRGQL